MIFRLFISMIMILISIDSSASIRYWVGNGANSNWNNTVNWSASSGGSSGATVPSTSDTTRFDAGGTGNCTFNINVSVKYFVVSNGYTGTISQGSYTFTIANRGGIFSGGSFSGGSASMFSTGPFVINGTNFTTTSGTLSLADDFTFSSGSFSHNSGNVRFSKTSTITGSITFYDLEFNGVANAAYTIATGTILTVIGELKFGATSDFSLLGGTIEAKGNITVTNTSSGGARSTQLNILGNANQVVTGSGVSATGFLPSININKTGGTLTLNSIISVQGDWAYVAGTVDASTNNSSVLIKGSNLDPQGTVTNMSFYNLSIYSTVVLQGSLRVDGVLNIYSNKSLSTNSSSNYTMYLAGTFNINGSFIGNTSTVQILGTGTKNITGAGEITIHDLIINKTSGSIQLLIPVKIVDTLTLVNGKIITSSASLLTMQNGSSLSGGNVHSCVDGPMKKKGNTSFIFPLGVGNLYRPLELSAPANSADEFVVQYFDTSQTLGLALDSAIIYNSECEYWSIDQVTTNNSTVSVRLTWGGDQCLYNPVSNFLITKWNGAKWISIGNIDQSGNLNSGSFGSSQSFTEGSVTIGIKFTTFDIQSDIHDLDGSSLGDIDLTITNGNPPYTYDWSHGPTTSSVDNLGIGNYTVTIKDEDNRTQTKTYAIGKKINWDLVEGSGVTFSGISLVKGGGSDDWCTSKISSTDRAITADSSGWVEFKVNSISIRQMVGFSVFDTIRDLEITHRFYINDTLIYAVEMDQDGIYYKRYLGLASIGDILKIEFDGDIIRYFRNDELLFQKAYYSEPDWKFNIVSNIYNQNGTINNIRSSFRIN